MEIKQIEIHPRKETFDEDKKCIKYQSGTLVFCGDGKERSYSFQFAPYVRFIDTRIVTLGNESKTGRIALEVPSLYAQVFGAYLGKTAFGWVLNHPSEEELRRQFEQMGSRHSTNDKDYMCGILHEAFSVLSKVVREEDLPLWGPTGLYLLGGAKTRNAEFHRNLRARITERMPNGLRRLIEEESAVEVGDSWDGMARGAPLIIEGTGLYGIEAKIFQPS